jgi:hypothetical protein
MTQFDPYHEWLGIPPEERPLSYYRLLGISNFESNPDVIQMAVKKRAEKLRGLLTGDNQQLGQEVIKNIATAKACLLNVQQKELYDKKLRAALQPAQPAAKPRAELKADLLSDEASKVSSSKWMMVPAVVAVVTVIIVLVVVMQPEEGKQVSTTIPQEPSASSPADSTTSDPADSPTTDPADSPTTDPADSPTTDPADSPTTDPADSPTTDPADSPTTDPADSPTTDPADSPTTDPAESPTTDPADSPTTDPADSPTTDPADSTTTSSVTPAYTKPVNWIKRAIPPLDERVAAVARWENVFKEQIAAAQGRLDKAALAGKAFQKSNGYVLTDPNTNWAELFAILQFSYIMARDSGSKVQTDIIRERLDEIFSVDVLELRLGECQVWEKSIVRYPTAPHVAGFVNLTGPTSHKGESLPVLYEEIAVQAEALQRYDIAAESYEGLVRLQETITGKAPVAGAVNIVDTQLADIITELKGRVATWKTGKARAVVAQQRFFDYQKALELLKQNPQDPAANRDAGVYVAFVRGNWNEGCRYLANGPAEPLTSLAKLELRRLNPVVPNSVSAMQSLGDGWANYGQREAEPVDRRPVYHHASDWYERAVKVTNSPLDKGELEKKISTLAKLDVNVAVAPVAVGGKLFDRIVLDTNQPMGSWPVAIPAGLTADKCSLQITKLVGFPSNAEIPKQKSIVSAGEDIVIVLNDPARIKFRVQLDTPKKADPPKIVLRSFGQQISGGDSNFPLSVTRLEVAIMRQMEVIRVANVNLAQLQAFLPKLKAVAAKAKGTAAAQTTQSNVNTCQRRIAAVPRTIADCEKRIARFMGIRQILTSLHGTAEIHFKIVPTPKIRNPQD